MRGSVYAKTIGLVYVVTVMFGIAGAIPVYHLFHVDPLILALIVLVSAIPVAFIIFRIMMNRQKKDPYGKLHFEMMLELFKNGYSEKFFEVCGKVLEAHKNGEKINVVYLKDFILYPADYYNINRQYDRALPYFAYLNENDFTGKSDTFIDQGMSALMYYGTLMETLRGLNDKAGATALIDRAKPILDRTFKNDVLAMASLNIYYNYYMLMGAYDRAGELVKQIISYESAPSKRYYSRYYVEAEYDLHLGKQQEAVEALKKMEPIIKGEGETLLRYVYRKMQENLFGQVWSD